MLLSETIERFLDYLKKERGFSGHTIASSKSSFGKRAMPDLSHACRKPICGHFCFTSAAME